MKTNHQIIFGNSCNMQEISSEKVNLIVTSPPYPMIEMWDEQFSVLNTEIKEALQQEDGMRAYFLMNDELNRTWKEVDRVLTSGGIVCINIGDATRKLGKSFQLYANHSQIISFFEKMGYQVLPPIIWRKQSNKPNKFMGSGMLPPNAYVTLEHEYILIFRKGSLKKFKDSDKLKRQESAYFWEERNVWFSDVWTDLKGISQKMNHKDLRNRSAAYPFELAYRIINMYSINGDTVLDPFLGTGTTTLAAMCSARNSIGYEIDGNFEDIIDDRLDEFTKFSREIIVDRFIKHSSFVEKRYSEKKEFKHTSLNYGFPVITNQEKNILIPFLDKIEKVSKNKFEVNYKDEIPESFLGFNESDAVSQKKSIKNADLSDFIEHKTVS